MSRQSHLRVQQAVLRSTSQVLSNRIDQSWSYAGKDGWWDLNNARLTVKPMTERLLSVDEVAEFLGVKRDTIYKWINRHGLPARKAGRLWKFKRDEVEEWFDRQPRHAHDTDDGTQQEGASAK